METIFATALLIASKTELLEPYRQEAIMSNCKIENITLRKVDRFLKNLPKYELPKPSPDGSVFIRRLNPTSKKIKEEQCKKLSEDRK